MVAIINIYEYFTHKMSKGSLFGTFIIVFVCKIFSLLLI